MSPFFHAVWWKAEQKKYTVNVDTMTNTECWLLCMQCKTTLPFKRLKIAEATPSNIVNLINKNCHLGELCIRRQDKHGVER